MSIATYTFTDTTGFATFTVKREWMHLHPNATTLPMAEIIGMGIDKYLHNDKGMAVVYHWVNFIKDLKNKPFIDTLENGNLGVYWIDGSIVTKEEWELKREK